MFNDHLLFSNNIIDAAHQLKNIQLQKLQEEKYKKLCEQLQQQIDQLQNLINEAEMYSPQQMLARGRSPQAASKRAALLQKLK
jgi:exonuclease VII large subunit